MADITQSYRFYVIDPSDEPQARFRVRLYNEVTESTNDMDWTGVFLVDVIYEQMRGASANADKGDVWSWPVIRFEGPKDGPWAVTVPPNDPVPGAFDPGASAGLD